jgi:ubiquinol-cytochrome c reductase iron-sulfur subunit
MKRRICSQRENVFVVVVVVVVVHHRPSPMPFFCFSFFALSPPLSHALFPPTCHSPTYLPRIRIGDLPASGAHHALGHGRRCRRHAPDDARAPEPDGRHYVSWKKIMLEVVSRCFCLFLRTCVENRQGTKRPRRIGGNETAKGRENRARNASFFLLFIKRRPRSFFFFFLTSPSYSSNKQLLNSYDTHSHEQFTPGDDSKRAFTYFVLTGGRFIYASALRLAVLKFVLSMTATADVLAMASLEVDLAKISPGQTITVKWRGKPVFVRRRTDEDVESARAVPLNTLRDPQTDESRVVDPEWLVLVGVCTHLGCVPLPGAGDYGGWFCPCHGSHYDTSGRIRKGPAPTNLEVPEYKFLDEKTLLVG